MWGGGTAARTKCMGVGTVKARHGGQHGCEQGPMSAVQRALLSALVALAFGPVSTAMAAPPTVTIESPPNGSVSNNQTPSFSGLAEELAGEVTLNLYKGPTATGTVIQEFKTLPLLGTW